MTKYYSPSKHCILFVDSEATAEHWDSRWDLGPDTRERMLSPRKESLVMKITKKHLTPSDGTVLEGGCGRGHYVFELEKNGFKCIGVDFAQETISKLNEYVPEIDVRYGDVRKLQFSDNSFAGYWSLGVIEHFYDGYEDIALEMNRVIKPGGYLFLVFPHFSLLRRIKAYLHIYPRWNKEEKPGGFYQFALNSRKAETYFKMMGFDLVSRLGKDGLKGTMDEVPLLRPFMRFLYEYKGKNLIVRIVRKLFDLALSPVAGHSILIVMRSKKAL